MLKAMRSGAIWVYPLNRRSNIKCEGYTGFYSIIDAAVYNDRVHVLLEHNEYGDETALLLARLPLYGLRWYVLEKNGVKTKSFFVRQQDILEETYDTLSVALLDYDADAELEDIEYFTDEELEAQKSYNIKKREEIYDEVCRVLTDWESQEAVDDDLYWTLVEVQKYWESVITAQEDN